MVIKFLDLVKQYRSIKPDIDAAIAEVIEEAAFIGGPHVKAFEDAFGAWVGAAHCIGVANGTDALEIALEALDLPKGAEIIVPGNSFIASSEAVTRSGFRVVFADVDPGSYTLDPTSVRAKLTPRTAALMVVHLHGHPGDMDELGAIAREHGLRLIEDCAQAHGAAVNGARVGAIGDVATFSFYPGKNLGAYGDAGAITTNDEQRAKRMRMIANHGRIGKYDHEFEGRNSRLDGLQAAILNVKLRYLDGWTAQRIAVANRYLDQLRDVVGITLPVRSNWARHVYHLFVIRTERRDALAAYLTEKGIQTGIHYPIALPRLKAYDYLGQGDEAMFVNQADRLLLSLPINETMSPADVDEVCAVIRGFFETN
ncbi:DegT/DnrJ/EryC1/StrS family aminotransferase [Mesorhizobium sp. A623]